MTLENLHNILQNTGYPVAYRAFNKPVEPPFIIYVAEDTDNFMADGSVYQKVIEVDITLCSVNKDLEAEAKVEEALNGFTWNSHEDYVNDELLNQVTYYISMEV